MEAKGRGVLVAVCPALLETASWAECDRSVSSTSQRLAMDAFICCSELDFFLIERSHMLYMVKFEVKV